MGWLRLDDGFFLHPKALAAGRDGRDVYLAALCYSNQQQTDGIIPAHALPLIAGLSGVADAEQAAARLVEVRLWRNHVDGWEINDFLDYQQSKTDREEWKRRERDRKARAREAAKSTQEPEIVRAEGTRNPNGIHPGFRASTSEVRTSESKRSGGGTRSPVSAAADRPVEGTTTTLDPRAQRALGPFATLLTRQYARDGEEDAYRASILRNPAEHLERLNGLARQHPESDPDELAELCLASRRKAKPKPRCGICKGDPHPNGPEDCPAMNGDT